MNTKLFTSKGLAQPKFLPMSKKEMDALGWEQLDVLLISGDSYVDHPSFGMALLGRVLVAHGFRTGIVTQPDWEKPDSVSLMGAPRLFTGITAGAIDSMLAHYTAFRKKRSDDAYTPGGMAGKRPNRATIVYTNLARRAFPGVPVILGGIEASLRRTSHYDFWTSKVRRSVLLDSKADLIIYGMGEKALVQAATRLDSGHPDCLKGIYGTVFKGVEADIPEDAKKVVLPGHDEILKKPDKLMAATLAQEQLVQDGQTWAVQESGQTIIIAPPATEMDTDEMDALYGLYYSRQPHPDYDKPIPAHEMIKDSITSHRGCGGGCSFCSLALHQGRKIRSRSRRSIMDEVKALTKEKWFKGNISDIGGPSANMWQARCENTQGRLQKGRAAWFRRFARFSRWTTLPTWTCCARQKRLRASRPCAWQAECASTWPCRTTRLWKNSWANSWAASLK